MDKLTIAKQINHYNMKNSIRNLAKNCDVSVTMLAKVRDGISTPTLYVYFEICNALGLDPAEQIKNEDGYRKWGINGK